MRAELRVSLLQATLAGIALAFLFLKLSSDTSVTTGIPGAGVVSGCVDTLIWR